MLALILDYAIAWYFSNTRYRWFVWLPGVLLTAALNAVVIGFASQYLAATISGRPFNNVLAIDAVIAGVLIHPIVATAIATYRRVRHWRASKQEVGADRKQAS